MNINSDQLQKELQEAFRLGLQGQSYPDYKDPFDRKFLGARATQSQLEAWPKSKEWGAKIALIGGKGSGKTVFDGAVIVDRAQRFPGSKGFMAANTYNQVVESVATKLVWVADMMGIELIYKEKMTIDRLPHRHVYFFPAFGSYCCMRSADNMDMIEGSEWDYGAIEEVSFWTERKVSTAMSRLRRSTADHGKFIYGMPEDSEFWMYKYFEENDYNLWEIDTRENVQNLPPEYIANLLSMYPGDLGKRYVSGKRVSLHNMPMYPSYDTELHRGKVSKRICTYDPYRPVYIIFDFNVAPLCATVWQIKPLHQFKSDRTEAVSNVGVQIDEFEVWSAPEGSTSTACDLVLENYGSHKNGMVIAGDASGNSKDTRSASQTDYKIISDKFDDIPSLVIRRGLIVNRKTRSNKGRRSENRDAKFTNPPLKDSIQVLNSLLVRPDGTIGIFFLPESRYESGGAARSVSSAKFSADGRPDSANDKQYGRDIARSHYADTVRYFSWLITGGRLEKVIEPSASSSLDYSLGDGRNMLTLKTPIY